MTSLSQNNIETNFKTHIRMKFQQKNRQNLNK